MLKVFRYATLSISLLVFPLTAAANLVTDGGFEVAPVPGSFETLTGSVGEWTITAGSVDLIGGYWQPAGGAESLDAAGLANGRIQQVLSTVPARLYRLTFAMSGNPDGPPTTKELEVGIDNQLLVFTYDIYRGTPLVAYNSRSDMKWETHTLYFTATSSQTVLSFRDVSDPAAGWSGVTPWGAALDNVSVVPVPEPAALLSGALLLLPFGGSVIRILRRNRKA